MISFKIIKNDYIYNLSKEDDSYKELIQSDTKPDTGHHMRK